MPLRRYDAVYLSVCVNFKAENQSRNRESVSSDLTIFIDTYDANPNLAL